MSSPWLQLVMPRKLNVHEDRPCVLCGDCSPGARKTISVDEVLAILDMTSDKFKKNQVWRTIENVCLSAIAVQKKEKIQSFHETASICCSCMNWTQRKKCVKVTPILHLKWHFRTLMPINKKRFDKRVIHRLSVILSQPDNFYRCLFTKSELKAMEKMAKMKAKDVNLVVAALYQSQNIHSLFVTDSNVAELVRR